MKKKIFALTLVAVLVVSVLAACGTKKQEPAPTEQPSNPAMVGGYEITESPAAVLPDDLQAIFDEAAGQWNGGELKAIALLGTQVVSGTNYAFLAQSSLGGPKYHIAFVYKDLDGNVKLSKVADIDVAAAEFGGAMETGIPGGWQIADNTYAAPNRVDAEVLMEAQAELVGANYELIANLATQIVAGTNYRFLCKTTPVTQDPAATLTIVTIYKDLDGKVSITDVQDFNVAEYNQ